MSRQRIGVAVITRNEADRISRLLASVAFADEIVVVDSGSTDETPDICRKSGARVVFQEWLGYAAQKQVALELVSADWVLSLDADEWLSERLATEIREAARDCPEAVRGFSMPRLSRYLGRWIRHGGWYPDRKIRLVRRGAGRWIGDGLHEKLEVSGAVRRLHQPILHDVYRDIADQVATINRFSDVHASVVHSRGPGYAMAGVLHAAVKFLECYVWKSGFLDGVPGLVIAMNSAWYVFLKHAKVWEKGMGT